MFGYFKGLKRLFKPASQTFSLWWEHILEPLQPSNWQILISCGQERVMSSVILPCPAALSDYPCPAHTCPQILIGVAMACALSKKEGGILSPQPIRN